MLNGSLWPWSHYDGIIKYDHFDKFMFTGLSNVQWGLTSSTKHLRGVPPDLCHHSLGIHLILEKKWQN